MKENELNDLPLTSSVHEFQITEDFLAKFNKVLRREPEAKPALSVGAIALKGVFEILNHLEVDWRGLLHVSQSFDYKNPLEKPCRVSTQSKLVRCRNRGGRFWLFFETIMEHKEQSLFFGTGYSQIMVSNGKNEVS